MTAALTIVAAFVLLPILFGAAAAWMSFSADVGMKAADRTGNILDEGGRHLAVHIMASFWMAFLPLVVVAVICALVSA